MDAFYVSNKEKESKDCKARTPADVYEQIPLYVYIRYGTVIILTVYFSLSFYVTVSWATYMESRKAWFHFLIQIIASVSLTPPSRVYDPLSALDSDPFMLLQVLPFVFSVYLMMSSVKSTVSIIYVFSTEYTTFSVLVLASILLSVDSYPTRRKKGWALATNQPTI